MWEEPFATYFLLYHYYTHNTHPVFCCTNRNSIHDNAIVVCPSFFFR